jgi:HAE1 family hydrophobic/amphiphilic exporter-1
MAVGKEISEILKKTNGLKAWVTIGGYSILDFANVSNFITTFVVYDDWDKRGAALSQDVILANLRQELSKVESAGVFVAVPPPIRIWQPAVSGDDRGRKAWEWLNCSSERVLSAGNAQSGLSNLANLQCPVPKYIWT